jgi:hypothetical protein
MIPESSIEKEKTTTHIVLYRALVKIVKIVRTENDLLFPETSRPECYGSISCKYLIYKFSIFLYKKVNREPITAQMGRSSSEFCCNCKISNAYGTVPTVASGPSVPIKRAFLGDGQIDKYEVHRSEKRTIRG